MQKLIWLGMAGALGALARYGLGGLVQRHAGATFPWGTMVVNVLGAFLFGLVWSLAETRVPMSAETRIIILAGFMGSFTTFSTLIFETGFMLTDGDWWPAALNVLGQIILGLIALFAGLWLGRLI